MYSDSNICINRVKWPLVGVKTVTMMAVGVGIAPMIQMIRSILVYQDPNQYPIDITLLYGAVSSY